MQQETVLAEESPRFQCQKYVGGTWLDCGERQPRIIGALRLAMSNQPNHVRRIWMLDLHKAVLIHPFERQRPYRIVDMIAHRVVLGEGSKPI
jgi:hypothetical protein